MNSKKIAREIITLSSKIKDEKTLTDAIASKVDLFADKEAKKINDKSAFIAELRTLFADYAASGGCGCCANLDKQEQAMNKISSLLQIEPYEDGSGFNIYKYQSNKNANT